MNSHYQLFDLSREFLNKVSYAENDVNQKKNDIYSNLNNNYSIYVYNYSNNDSFLDEMKRKKSEFQNNINNINIRN
jgi:hypothetical protein